MATQNQADATLAHHQYDLFEKIPNLVKLSVVESSDGNWIIEAGVIDMSIQTSVLGTSHAVEAVPPELQVPDPSGKTLKLR